MLLQFNMTVNIMHKIIAMTAVLLMIALLLPLCSCRNASSEDENVNNVKTLTYEKSDAVIYNPLIGFASEADYTKSVGENTLVYIEVLWKNIEPQEGVYDFSELEKINNLEKWRAEGKHAVLRFMCDKPSTESHMDIPEWLYKKTKDGTFYQYDASHAGYSPDYNNTAFIEAHEKAIAALGAHFSNDTFVSYVELGSLGHWGEWHVNYESGIVRIPKADVREKYVTPYIKAFPNAKFLMRRPFNTAAEHGFGLFDDTAGNPTATSEWLKWIIRGGDYAQAEEKNALTPMIDAWKTAPIGGEFNSDIAMSEMLTTSLSTTLSLLNESHTSFLGPNFPNGLSKENGEGCEDGIEAVQKNLGYRLYVEKAAFEEGEDSTTIDLTWNNSGIAPIYWDWDVYLYFYDNDKHCTGKYPVDIRLTDILPNTSVNSKTNVSAQYLQNVSYVALGIEDPLTKKPAVQLAMKAEQIDKTVVLWTQN